jgi:hypothetical protein
MIKCQLALLAKGVIRDADTNAISIYHIIEEVKAASFPVFFPEVAFFAYLVREDGDPSVLELQGRISVDDAVIVDAPMKADFQGLRGNRQIFRIGGLPVPKPGMLVAELFNKENGESIGRYEARVSTIGKQPQVKIEETAS